MQQDINRSKLALILTALICSACTADSDMGDEFCELSSSTPTATEIEEGLVTATQDGSAFEGEGSWSATTGSLTGGLLDIIIQNDESGERTADKVSAGDFPICVQIGDRSDNVGQANLVSGGFVSDADNTGSLSILAQEGDYIVGRFSFSLADTSGETTVFEDGLFRVAER
jgi:hypothetical protein